MRDAAVSDTRLGGPTFRRHLKGQEEQAFLVKYKGAEEAQL